MSAIFGAVNLSNTVVPFSHLEKMGETMVHRGPDGVRLLQEKHIGFGHCMLHTTPQSLDEKLPYTDSDGWLSISSDMRIDNRNDLGRKLGIHTVSECSDSQLILSAYKKWGTECFSHLIGDFSIAIWDSKLQQLICARDFIGIKPFYYSQASGDFLFASEIKALATHPNISLTVNKGMLAEYLSCSFCSRTETLFLDINRLAAGHYLTFSAKGLDIRQYWECSPKPSIFYKNSEEYTEHFLEIFRTSVDARLRSQKRVSFELSGGLDSSCVVGMANTILRGRNSAPPNTYAMVFPGLACDERTFIEAASIHNHISPKYINVLRKLTLKQFESQKSFMPCHVPNLTITDPLFHAVLADNSRVVLSGVGGDQCFSGSSLPYLELLQHVKIDLLVKEFTYNLKIRRSTTLKNFFLTIGWPLLPLPLRMKLTRHGISRMIPSWFTEEFRKSSQIVDRIHIADPRNSTSNLKELFHKIAFGPREQWALEMIDSHRGALQIESRHPFLDQRIVNFALAIPTNEIRHLGTIKRLLRHSNNSLLPQKIRDRTGKAEFSFLINEILKKTIFTQRPPAHHLCQNGILTPNILQDAILLKAEKVRANQHDCGDNTWNLWFAYSVNMWYDTLSDIQ